MSSARICAGLVALVAWIGLAVQLQASTALVGSVSGAVWAMLLYFTVLTNLLVAVVFSLIALGRAPAAWIVGGTMMGILLVGVTYALLLRGLVELSGGARLADILLHKVTPVLVPLWWLAFARKGQFSAHDPFIWVLLPLGYFVYGIVRGGAGGKYPYPFMNPTNIGWTGVAAYAVALAVGFLLVSYAVLWLDRRLP